MKSSGHIHENLRKVSARIQSRLISFLEKYLVILIQTISLINFSPRIPFIFQLIPSIFLEVTLILPFVQAYPLMNHFESLSNEVILI